MMFESETNQNVRFFKACVELRKTFATLLDSDVFTRKEWLVLARLRHAENHPDAPRAAFLSDALNIPRPGITRILNSLESQDFIKREIDPENRRSIHLEITEKGIAALDDARTAVLADVQNITSALGETDCETLIALLERVVKIHEGKERPADETL